MYILYKQCHYSISNKVENAHYHWFLCTTQWSAHNISHNCVSSLCIFQGFSKTGLIETRDCSRVRPVINRGARGWQWGVIMRPNKCSEQWRYVMIFFRGGACADRVRQLCPFPADARAHFHSLMDWNCCRIEKLCCAKVHLNYSSVFAYIIWRGGGGGGSMHVQDVMCWSAGKTFSSASAAPDNN